jgi:hypothetical protein
MRITDFPELIAPTGNDLLVTVDIANDLTKKVKLDNLPISLPTLTALATKQNTLVSGTNIKTLNSVSLLGAGDIVLAATPSGVSGAIQFSNGSAFASDAANLFWDDTNNRLGIGTNAPTTALDVNGDIKTNNNIWIQGNAKFIYANTGGGSVTTGLYFRPNDSMLDVYINGTAAVTFGASTRTLIKGSGSTSATTSLLVQNSAGTELFKVQDDGGVQLATLTATNSTFFGLTLAGNSFYSQNDGGTTIGQRAVPAASAILDIRSGIRGFLPPRMTTTQKNAIASPATGLVLYDSTTNKLQCYNGSTWNDLF